MVQIGYKLSSEEAIICGPDPENHVEGDPRVRRRRIRSRLRAPGGFRPGGLPPLLRARGPPAAAEGDPAAEGGLGLGRDLDDEAVTPAVLRRHARAHVVAERRLRLRNDARLSGDAARADADRDA